MNFPFFISQRIRKPLANTFSATVSQIGTISVALGVAVGIVAFSVLSGFKQTVKDKVFIFGANLRISAFDLNRSVEESPLPINSPAFNSFDKNIRHKQAVAHKAGILKTPDELQGAVLKGIGKDYDWANFGQTLVKGRPIVFSDTSYSREVILSSKIANVLRLVLGQEVVMYFVQNPPRVRKLKIVGIYETNIQEFDDQLIIGDIALIQKLNGWNKNTAGSIELYVNDLQNLSDTKQQLKKQLPPEMNVDSVLDEFPLLFDWLALLDQNTLILLTLILFVACFNIVSVLLVMMMERTSMIGLLKTLGSPNIQIRQVFFYVGLQIVVKGLFWGNLLGFGLCWLQQKFKLIPLNPTNYYMSFVPIRFELLPILLLNLGVLFIVALILIIPTLVIGRIRPIQALIFRK